MERLEIAPEENSINELIRRNADLERMHLYTDAHPTVDALRNQGIKTAAVTTIAAWRFVPFLRQKGIYIGLMCTTNEAKAEAWPEIFLAILGKFGVGADQALMVGDDLKTDILSAKRVGFETVLLRWRDKSNAPMQIMSYLPLRNCSPSLKIDLAAVPLSARSIMHAHYFLLNEASTSLKKPLYEDSLLFVGWVTLGLRSFLSSAAKMMKLAKKPGRDELWLSIKICILGVAAIGAVGYIIHIVSAVFQQWSNVT